MRVLKLVCLALTLASSGGMTADAQGSRVSIANGLVSFTLPSGWKTVEESTTELIVGPGDRREADHTMDFCTCQTKPILRWQDASQETANEKFASMTAADINIRNPNEQKVVEFSNSTLVDGVRIARAVVRYENNLDMHIAFMTVVGPTSAAEITIHCNNSLPRAKDDDLNRRLISAHEADKAAIEKFLRSAKVTRGKV